MEFENGPEMPLICPCRNVAFEKGYFRSATEMLPEPRLVELIHYPPVTPSIAEINSKDEAVSGSGYGD